MEMYPSEQQLPYALNKDRLHVLQALLGEHSWQLQHAFVIVLQCIRVQTGPRRVV
jgi:hypothetical protein